MQGVRIERPPGAFGPAPVNFTVAGTTCIGATLAFTQTCEVRVGFRWSPARPPFGSGDQAQLSLANDASHAEQVTLLASSTRLLFP